MGVRLNRTIVIARGKNREAMAFAAEVSSYLKDLTGIPLTWGMEVGGTVGRVHWFADYDDMAGLESALQTTMTDDGYQKLLDGVVDVFVGSAEDTLVYTM